MKSRPLTRRASSRKNKKRRTVRRKKTHRPRLRGGDAAIEEMMRKYPLGKPVIVNPKSKFVVCTYWWGRGNSNKNFWRFGNEKTDAEVKEGKIRVNYECPSEISENLKWDYLDDLRDEAKVPKEDAKTWDKKTLESPEFKDNLTKLVNKVLAERAEKGDERQKAIKMEEMIERWKDMCRKANCNYLVQEYPFERGQYQTAINMKPNFIAEALKVASKEGRAVLYIDGDMVIDRYPDIFDMPSVDFMARGWNCDPRSSSRYMKSGICFDPYIFETSGGIMYFAPTPQANRLLRHWAWLSSFPDMKGRADDRILSIILTTEREHDAISTVQLPIEYLWLTDAYLYHPPSHIDKSRIYVSHPACLTSEEAAREQGAANSREPPGYEELIIDPTNCETDGGYFYEYVYFTERRFVETFQPYLNYLRIAKNRNGASPIKVIDFEDKYGPYNTVSLRNIDAMASVKVVTGQKMVTLPQDATVPQILANLKAGMHVIVGRFRQKYSNDYDIIATNNGGDQISQYQTEIKIETDKPMYFSANNPVVYHLLMMCKTLDDMNMHFKQSYLFSSRIRGFWTKTNRTGMTAEQEQVLREIEANDRTANNVPEGSD